MAEWIIELDFDHVVMKIIIFVLDGGALCISLKS